VGPVRESGASLANVIADVMPEVVFEAQADAVV
jgi:hypothetical protein